MSRRAIRLMNSVFHDVNADEIAASTDAVCIICREEMLNTTETPPTIIPGSIKRLPCGHIFHATCLRNWFQRQQTCPTCRLNILRRPDAGAQGNRRRRDQPRTGQEQQSQQQQQQNQAQEQAQNRRTTSTAHIRIDIQRTPGSGTAEANVQQSAIPPGVCRILLSCICCLPEFPVIVLFFF